MLRRLVKVGKVPFNNLMDVYWVFAVMVFNCLLIWVIYKHSGQSSLTFQMVKISTYVPYWKHALAKNLNEYKTFDLTWLDI